MEFRVLGPVQLWVGDRPVDLGPGKQRCVLGVLLVGAGRTQPVELLIDRVWGEDPPSQVRSALYSYVSRLRRVLRDAGAVSAEHGSVLRQRPGGYLLDVPAGSVDLHRFEALTTRARTVADPVERAYLLRTALELWQGPPLQDLPGRWADEIRQGLRRQRVWAGTECARALGTLGRHVEASALLERELADSPLAEPLAGQLMRALLAQGRRAEALECYARLRERLADELGVEPEPALRELHVRILR